MSDCLFPEEFWIEILKRVPARSLLKCRLVCKSWYSLITNPNFISLQITQSIESQKNSKFLLEKNKFSRFIEVLLCNDDDDFYSGFRGFDIPFEHLTLGLTLGRSGSGPFGRDNYRGLRIFGSCHGLVLVSHSFSRILHLWNPAIGKCLSISNPFTRTSPSIKVFGYDRKNNDYKVVEIRKYPPSKIKEVEIYSLRTNSWKSISVANNTGFDDSSSVYLNGSIHWLAHKSLSTSNMMDTIACFDLGDEAFQELGIPETLLSYDHLSLMVCDQLLSLVEYISWENDNLNYGICCDKCCIWIMKEYGVSKSWSKYYVIDLQDGRSFYEVFNFRSNGEALLYMNSRELASYDPKTKKITSVGFLDESSYMLHAYTESLLFLETPRLNGISISANHAPAPAAAPSYKEEMRCWRKTEL